ncbi:MAG: VOC family protein [Candidatus Acidiferrales bacterium]
MIVLDATGHVLVMDGGLLASAVNQYRTQEIERMPWAIRILVWSLCCSGAGVARAQSVDLAGIAHAAFRVNDVEKSRAFYQLLGFEQSFEFSQGGNVSVSYVKVNDRQFIELYQRPDTSQPAGFLHVCFESNDIEPLWREYVKRGLDAAEPRKAKAGNLLNAIHDPPGNLIEFTQYMPGSMHFEDRGKHLGRSRVSDHLRRVAIPTKDSSAVAAFYTGKLGFEPVISGDDERLRLPGPSGDEVEFISAVPPSAPQVVFEVSDLRRAAKDLRARGLKVRRAGQMISVTAPDGVVVAFAARR